MTTFAELESLVVEQTRRPEISSVTKAAIRTATLRAHHTDFFPRDLAQGPLTYTLSSIAQFYDFPNISQTLLRLRSLKLIHGIDTATSVPVEQLEFREADDLFDADGNRRPHIYTLVGELYTVDCEDCSNSTDQEHALPEEAIEQWNCANGSHEPCPTKTKE